VVILQHHSQCLLGRTPTPFWRGRKPSVPLGVSSMEVKRKIDRRHKRMAVPVCAWLDFRGDSATRAMRSLDLSLEGARFATIRPVRTGDAVMARLEIRSGESAVECKGRVCWVRPMQDRVRHFGVRFVDLSDEERSRIEQLLNEAARQAPLAAV
jgi:hypothetical protein